MKFSEAHRVLGVPEGSDKDTIRKAFKKAAKQYHPDINKEKGAEDKFKEINTAYQVIEKGEQPEQNMGWGGSVSGFNISDLFNNFAGQGRPKKRISAPDITIEETMTFRESVLGATKEITYKHNIKCSSCNGAGEKTVDNGCSSCRGSGRIRTQQGNTIFESSCGKCRGKMSYESCKECQTQGYKTVESVLTINIPPGAIEGSVLSLGGRGNFAGEAFGQDQSSHLSLLIHIIPQEGLSIKDQDVFSSVNISLLEAFRGCDKTIPTIDGDKEITIPSLIKNREEIELPRLGLSRKGKQIVSVLVSYPENVEALIEVMKGHTNEANNAAAKEEVEMN